MYVPLLPQELNLFLCGLNCTAMITCLVTDILLCITASMLCLLHLRTLVYHTCLYAVQPVSVSDLVKRRIEASQKLQVNPADPEAKGTLHSIDQQVHVCRAIHDCSPWFLARILSAKKIP